MRVRDITHDMLLPSGYKSIPPETLQAHIVSHIINGHTKLLINHEELLNEELTLFLNAVEHGNVPTIGQAWAAWWYLQYRLNTDAWMADEISERVQRRRMKLVGQLVFSDVRTEVYERSNPPRRV